MNFEQYQQIESECKAGTGVNREFREEYITIKNACTLLGLSAPDRDNFNSIRNSLFNPHPEKAETKTALDEHKKRELYYTRQVQSLIKEHYRKQESTFINRAPVLLFIHTYSPYAAAASALLFILLSGWTIYRIIGGQSGFTQVGKHEDIYLLLIPALLFALLTAAVITAVLIFRKKVKEHIKKELI